MQCHRVPDPVRAVPVCLRQHDRAEPPGAGPGGALRRRGQGQGSQGPRGKVRQPPGAEEAGGGSSQGLPGGDGGLGGEAEQVGGGDEDGGREQGAGGVRVAREQRGDVGQRRPHRREHLHGRVLWQGTRGKPQGLHPDEGRRRCSGDQ